MLERVARAIERRLSYANVMSTIAVFIALGGGAFAAVGGIPDGSGIFHGCFDAKTGVLRVVRSEASCRKAKTVTRNGKHVRLLGEFAIAWNETGVAGMTGATGQPGVPGQPGAQGSPGPFPATLPSGQTLTGVYRASQTNAGDPVPDTVTFTYSLASKPAVDFIAPGAQPPTACPGSAAAPQAAPGHLCIYATQGNSGVSIADPETSISPGVSVRGFTVFDNFAGTTTNGTWAVTAP